MGIFISGTKADGSDAREELGVFINPENENEWSSEPYDEVQKKYVKDHTRYWNILNIYENEKPMEDIHEEILNKTSTLTRKNREFVLSLFTEDGI